MPTCPVCESEAYLCNVDHVDGPGPRLHCTNSSHHTSAVPPATTEQDS